MHKTWFEGERTEDIAALDFFPEAVDLIPDFSGSLLETLSALTPSAFTFDEELDFFAFLGSGFSSEPSSSLSSAFDFLRLVRLPPTSDSGRVGSRFFEGERICSSGSSV